MAVAALLAPIGCSLGADDEPRPVSGVAKQVADTVDELGHAIERKDFAEVCDRLFTREARRRAGGGDCAAQLRSAGEDVSRPTIEIRGIDVKDDRATVKVATEAEGQARLIDSLLLRREGTGWRIDALGEG